MRETHAWTQDRARARETNHVCLEALSLSRTSVVSVDTPAISSFFSLPYLGGGCKCLWIMWMASWSVESRGESHEIKTGSGVQTTVWLPHRASCLPRCSLLIFPGPQRHIRHPYPGSKTCLHPGWTETLRLFTLKLFCKFLQIYSVSETPYKHFRSLRQYRSVEMRAACRLILRCFLRLKPQTNTGWS